MTFGATRGRLRALRMPVHRVGGKGAGARAVLAAAALLAASTAVNAQSIADFYRGKTIDFYVGAAAGGGYDVVARLIAVHMSDHIPGHPVIVVHNMPGAAGVVGTNYLYNVAKHDGTAMGMPTSNVPVEPRLKVISPDGSKVKFDVARMRWIGTPVQEPQVTWVWHTAPVRSVADLKAHTILMGATTASADNSILPLLANALLGTRMKVVTGYRGQADINIAVERGEVQGNNTGLSNLTVNKAEWMRDHKVRILLQFGNKRLDEIKDVPTVTELATTDADRALMRFYGLKFSMARPLVLPPQVPKARADAIEAAFEATMKDPRYLADAKKMGLGTNWVGGTGMMRLIHQIQETPQPVVDRLRTLIAKAGKKK